MPRGRQTNYKGTLAQRPGSRRKAQWGIRGRISYHGRLTPAFFVTPNQLNRLKVKPENKPKVLGTKHVGLLGISSDSEDHWIGVKDRRRKKPERRVRKKERRKRQAGLVYGPSSHRVVSIGKSEFEELKEPKPTHLTPLPLIGDKGFLNRRDTDKNPRRHTDKR